MVKIKIEDILFWIFIAIVIGTALWLLYGSPPEMNAIITIALGVAGSELLIWKSLFKADKKTAISFMKIKNEIEKNNLIINNKLDNIESKLNTTKRR